MHGPCLNVFAKMASIVDIDRLPHLALTRATKAFFHHKTGVCTAAAMAAQYCRLYITWSKRQRHIYPLVTTAVHGVIAVDTGHAAPGKWRWSLTIRNAASALLTTQALEVMMPVVRNINRCRRRLQLVVSKLLTRITNKDWVPGKPLV